MERINNLFRKHFGVFPRQTERLVGAGSNRSYYRLTLSSEETVIGVEGTSREENAAFIYLSRHFRHCNLPVPEVLAVSDDGLCYLQTDLGACSLFDSLKNGRTHAGNYSEEECRLLEQTLRLLPEIQLRGAVNLEWENCYPQPAFDVDNVMFDLNYFKYCFLKATGIDFHEQKLEADFRALAHHLTCGDGEEMTGFMYRDFQARNVMLSPEGSPLFIDFQGGRRGPLYYDVASFLWQASARYSDTLRHRLVHAYYDALATFITPPPVETFWERLWLFVFFRTLQVLGAYGFRGYFEQKRHFIDSIPGALNNLCALLEKGIVRPYPYLEEVLTRLVQLPRYASLLEPCKNHETFAEKQSEYKGAFHQSQLPVQAPLVVRVFSFSYKKGIPEDPSGNGGGYVFDCRSTHNPGRYEPYKQLTGLDEPVIRFLEDDGEITTFLTDVYHLADRHVQRYLERGFTSLMFAFGCTGGQHRSVYSAQHLAEHLHAKYGIAVELLHREQGIAQSFPAR